MKTTRLILALAAALSLGLAVFANVRTNHNAVSTSTVTDELVTSGTDNDATGVKVADDLQPDPCGLSAKTAGVKVADDLQPDPCGLSATATQAIAA